MTSSTTRTTLTLELVPIAGSRFQPTGFPDLGAATFERAGAAGEQLLVESVQSMANHLEATTWNAGSNEPAAEVASIPHVRVVDEAGVFLTSSRLEAHRMASVYVLDSKHAGTDVRETLRQRFGLEEGRPLDIRRVAAELFKLDPLSLIHGVFFAQKWPWQPKIARAVTSFIEASDVRPAVSGGVKRDSVHNEQDTAAGRTAEKGFGMVPHQRTEYTAAAIRLYVVIDEQQFASYGLSANATEVLSALAGWELASLLHNGLRLRTACDFVVADVSTGDVPSLDAASQRLAAAISAAKDDLGPTTEVVWSPGKAGRAKSPTTGD